MRKTIVAGLMGVLLAVAAGNVAAQVAGSTTIGAPATEITTLTKGWSAKNQILGKLVYNEQDEKVGQVEDIIVAPDCGMKYMPRATAFGKLKAMCDAAAAVRREIS